MGGTDIIQRVLDVIVSDSALFLYAWVAVIGVALAAVGASFATRGALREFEPEDFYEMKRGRPCLTRACKRRESERLRAVRQSKSFAVLKTLSALIFLGAVVPGLCLAVLVLKQDFFMPDLAPALIDDAGPVAPRGVQVWALIMFLFGNSVWGAVVEINTGFALTGVYFEPGLYSVNPDNVVFANLATAYKFWTAPLMGLVALTITRAITGWKLVDQRLKNFA